MAKPVVIVMHHRAERTLLVMRLTGHVNATLDSQIATAMQPMAVRQKAAALASLAHEGDPSWSKRVQMAVSAVAESEQVNFDS